MRRRLSLVAVLATAGLVTAPVPAHAHSDLRDASPAAGQEVAPGVAVVALTFTGLDPDGPRQLTLTGPDDAVVPVASRSRSARDRGRGGASAAPSTRKENGRSDG